MSARIAAYGLLSYAILGMGSCSMSVQEIVVSGKVPAQQLLDKFHGEWGGDISRVYEESF